MGLTDAGGTNPRSRSQAFRAVIGLPAASGSAGARGTPERASCRAATGSAFLPWGEIERAKLRVTKGADSLMVIGDADANHAMRCGECGSLLYWTLRDGTYVRVAYGSLIDEPALKPTAHIFVGSKAPWHEILDDLPQHDEY